MIWKIASSSQEQNIPRPGKKNMSSHSNGILSFQGQQSFIASSPKAKPDSALKSFLSGGVGGLCVVLVGHPLDLVKVKIQTGKASGDASVFSMIRKTFATEGITGLYRGVSAPLVAVTPMFAICFWGYDMGKKIVKNADKEYKGDAGSYPFTIKQLCVAGGLSALPATVFMAPSERLKCLLQIHPEKYNGLMDCAKKVYAEGGIRSVYRGTAATLLRDVPGSVIYFGTYELIKKGLMDLQNIDPKSGSLSPLTIMCAGGFAGMANWAAIIPIDVLKSRFQTAPPGTYSGIVDVYRHLMKKEGPSALVSGMRPALIRAFPANAACFFGMEVAKKAFAFLD